MMFPKIFALYWAMVLVGYSCATPLDSRQVFGQRVTLGYRTVSKEQATDYNRDGKITFDKTQATAWQLGPGVYTTPGPGEWAGEAGDWYCQITARKSTVNSLPKVWIPAQIWDDETKIHRWIMRHFPQIDATKAFRLSEIDRFEPLKQLVIVPGLLKGQKLDLKVVCKERWQQLPDTKRVDYSKWRNVLGDPQ